MFRHIFYIHNVVNLHKYNIILKGSWSKQPIMQMTIQTELLMFRGFGLLIRGFWVEC